MTPPHGGATRPRALGFTIEPRAGIQVIVWPDGACRPASKVEEELWEAYITALTVVEAIIYASDQCRGHAGCAHSMQPWQAARALLALTLHYEPKQGEK